MDTEAKDYEKQRAGLRAQSLGLGREMLNGSAKCGPEQQELNKHMTMTHN